MNTERLIESLQGHVSNKTIHPLLCLDAATKISEFAIEISRLRVALINIKREAVTVDIGIIREMAESALEQNNGEL